MRLQIIWCECFFYLTGTVNVFLSSPYPEWCHASSFNPCRFSWKQLRLKFSVFQHLSNVFYRLFDTRKYCLKILSDRCFLVNH
jgi:hypothetical protein